MFIAAVMPPIDTHLRDDTAEENAQMGKSVPITVATKECDFDKDPTALYLATQQKDWEVALARAIEAPDEASIWVSRKESNGKLRWRLLPLHAAIIFKAPESVVEAFLSAYPKGAECKDDQGMLPLHLAFRNGSTESIVNLLLVAYPKSIDVQDRKGRIPLVLAQASTSPNRDAFMRALERGPSYYAVAAAATERAAVTAGLTAIFDAKLIEIKTLHQDEMSLIQEEAKETKMVLEKRVEELETELLKTQETSQILVDHVNSLDAQLSSRSDTERFLATKIATLDSSLKVAKVEKHESESKLFVENALLKSEAQELQLKFDALEAEHGEVKAKLAAAEVALVNLEEEKTKSTKMAQEAVTQLEMETNVSKANAAIWEAQITNKIAVEQSMASQITALTFRLAESLGESASMKVSHEEITKDLTTECDSLRATVDSLTKKLQIVALALDNMSAQQEEIVKAAAAHEATMTAASVTQAAIIAESSKQVDTFNKGNKEREEIMLLIARQEEEVAKSVMEREAIIQAVKEQEERMALANIQREAVVTHVSKHRKSMTALIKSELSDFVPHAASEDVEFVSVEAAEKEEEVTDEKGADEKGAIEEDVAIEQENVAVEEEAEMMIEIQQSLSHPGDEDQSNDIEVVRIQ